MSLKDKLKENDFLRKKVKAYKIKREFNKDCKLYQNNYVENYNTINQLEYAILLLVHSLEKGFCHTKLRPFGEKKVLDLISKLKMYEKYDSKYNSTASRMGISILKKWIETYNDNNWEKTDTCKKAEEFYNNLKNIKFDLVEVGSGFYEVSDFGKYSNLDYYDAISTRHSVRDFLNKKITNEDLEYCINSAILSPSACNRQMVKLYYVEDDKKKDILKSLIMGLSGFNKETVNLFVVTFDISAFTFYGERNQGYLNAGLFSMNFVNAMHFKGIGSCFLQWGNTNAEEAYIKKVLGIPNNERIAIIIGAGYYAQKSLIAKSARKSINEIFEII